MKIGILGGGISGLTLATLLQEHDVEVLEAYSRPGGLCRSFEVNGFYGDYGGHVLFSKDNEALTFLLNVLKDNVHKVRRANRVLYKGAFVKYPFENDLASIPVEDRYECLYHFLYNDYPQQPNNLEEWVYATFGKGIAEKYLLPYNQKIWKIPPTQLSMSWVERIPKPPKEDVIKSALGISTEGYTHQLHFNYPVKGGMEALVQAMANTVKVTNNFRIKAIEKTGQGWAVCNESTETRLYDKIISTLPVFELFESLKNVDPHVHSLIKQLRYNSLIVALVCLSTQRRHNFSAVYVPDKNVIFHRICYMDYFSSQNSPKGCSSILAEMTTNNHDDIAKMSDQQIIDKVTNDLISLNLIDKKDIINIFLKKQKYAYIVNDIGCEERVQEFQTYLNQNNIPFCGRFAEYRYYNTDGCVRSAIKVAKNIQEHETVS